MQTTRTITKSGIDNVLDAAFKEGNPIAYEAYSEYGKDIKEYPSQKELYQEIERLIFQAKPFFQFALYYPESCGYIEIKKLQIDPKRCGGNTFRFSVRGWGLVFLQFNISKDLNVECRAAVNTQKRAEKWEESCPDLKSPNLWNWNVVERNARRIIRTINKHAQPGA